MGEQRGHRRGPSAHRHARPDCLRPPAEHHFLSWGEGRGPAKETRHFGHAGLVGSRVLDPRGLCRHAMRPRHGRALAALLGRAPRGASRTASSSASSAPLVDAAVKSPSSPSSASASSAATVKSYAEVPGPRPLPLLGNSWRFLPVVGKGEGLQGLGRGLAEKVWGASELVWSRRGASSRSVAE